MIALKGFVSDTIVTKGYGYIGGPDPSQGKSYRELKPKKAFIQLPYIQRKIEVGEIVALGRINDEEEILTIVLSL